MYRQSEKNLLSSNISSRCPHNMVNFGLLAAEIVSLVWVTPGNFNGFRVLAALLHGTLVVGVSQTAARNRGRHLYSAGRPSRWALAHISSRLCPADVAEVLQFCLTYYCETFSNAFSYDAAHGPVTPTDFQRPSVTPFLGYASSYLVYVAVRARPLYVSTKSFYSLR